jgi:protein-S-isoprenylcysteine O-methyltransferase Ste14
VTSPKPVSKARGSLAFIAGLSMFAAILFWPAGTLRWIPGWTYIGIFCLYVLIAGLVLLRLNPDLIVARMQVGKGTKSWDKIWAALFTPIFAGIYVVAALDAARFEWSHMSLCWWPVGFVLYAAGAALLIWSMAVNPFFEKTVRIQADRGHYVIDTGPYRYVRHPGYVGFSAWSLSAPLLLGSWWAFLPALLSIVGIWIRTAMEDRTLRRELAGYETYASRVRYRLVPGMW